MSTLTFNPTEPIYRRSPVFTPVLQAADFKVCEECGAPALIHPRLEIGASNATVGPARRTLCCSCLYELLDANALPKIGEQMWKCVECGVKRAWGWMHPADQRLLPALRCRECGTVTRHRFLCVA